MTKTLVRVDNVMTTTLNRIRAHSPCEEGWTMLLRHLGKTQADDEPIPFSVIVESNGLEDALWCCRAEPKHAREWRLFAVWCARQVQHLMLDHRSLVALDVAERHVNGEATQEELSAASAAADSAAAALAAQAYAASASAAAAAAAAVLVDASAAAASAAVLATNAAARAAAARASRAARSDAWATAADTARAAQTAKFLEIVEGGVKC